MAAEDWIDGDNFDSDGIAKCRQCGKWCVWRQTKRGWRLYEEEQDKIHYCGAAKPNEFKAIQPT
jgi:hypothetical protein